MSTPSAAYDKPSAFTSLADELGRRGTGYVVRFQRQLELHLVHLQLLRHRHGIRTVETRAAELLRGAAADRAHQPWDRKVLEAVGPDPLTHLFHRASRSDQLLGRTDVDAHEAWEAHRWARDPHMDLSRARGSQPLDDPARCRTADDRVVDRDDPLALD